MTTDGKEPEKHRPSADERLSARQSQRRPAVIAILLAGAVLAAGALYAAAGPDLEELDELTQKWLSLRAEISSVRSRWGKQEQMLSDELEMLRQRKQSLQEKLDEEKTRTSGLEDELSSAEAEKERLESAIEEACTPVADAQSDLKDWEQDLPDFMANNLESQFDALPAGEDTITPNNVSQKLQTGLGLYRRIEKLNNEMHLSHAVIQSPDGRSLECDMLFLGLARGYALTPNGKNAAVGSWTGDGWAWEWRKDIAPEVQKAIECYNKERAASFVNLPLSIGEVHE